MRFFLLPVSGLQPSSQIVRSGLSSLAGTGGARRDRTADLLRAKQALSQLSYGPDLTCLFSVMLHGVSSFGQSCT